MSRRRQRVLHVDEHEFEWSVGHRHERADDPHLPWRDCCEYLAVRHRATAAALLIEFRQRPGHLIPDGVTPSGCVIDSARRQLNLHQPGIVRELIDLAGESGWDEAVAGQTVLDGWSLLARFN